MSNWLSFLNQRSSSDAQDRQVASTGLRPASSLFETWLLVELRDQGPQRRSVLVDRLTELWLRDELRQGAGNVDAGLWGPRRIRGEVESLLQQLEGDFVRTSPAHSTAFAAA
jgi:hypothetical protein